MFFRRFFGVFLLSVLLPQLHAATAAESRERRDAQHSSTAESGAKRRVKLTEKEQAYLRGKKEIVVCDYGEFMPYIGHEKGQTFGIIVDYYREFESRIGVPMRFLHRDNLNACVETVRKGDADVVVSMGTPNTYPGFILSDEYGQDFVALVTKLTTPFVRDIQSMNKKRIGIVGQYRNMTAYLKSEYPSLKLVKVRSTQEGLDRVAAGTLDAFVEIYRIAAYRIRREHVGELKINTKISPLIMRAHVGLREGDVLLRDIFNKAIADLPAAEKTRIIDRWMRAEHVFRPDYRLIAEIVMAALFLLLLFLTYHLYVRYRQKLLLARQAKLAGMGSMINNIAHQWRQPLSRINSNIAVMKSVLESDEISREILAKKLDAIEETTEHMSGTIESFMQFFHPDKRMSDFSLQELVERAVKLSGLREAGVRVQIESEEAIRLHTYEKELLQVLLVILNNALENFKLRKIGDPHVRIKLQQLPQRVMIVIEDNGGGIPEEDLERIFEPFYSTKGLETGGSGLGLTMAKLLIEQSMLGILRVKNISQGARFEIILSRERRDG